MNKKPLKKEDHTIEYSAGGIVFRKLKRSIEIAFLLDPFDKWTFAKGHIEKGESILKAAIRETKEEMGIDRIRIISPLGRIDWWFREKRDKAYSKNGKLVHKYSYYYLMQVPEKTKLSPQKSELIKDVKWVPVEEAMSLSGYEDINPVLKKAIDILTHS